MSSQVGTDRTAVQRGRQGVSRALSAPLPSSPPAILAGQAPEEAPSASRSATADEDDDGSEPFGSEPTESLEELVDSAFEGSRVMAISLGDGDSLGEPILLAVTGTQPGQVIGTDLEDGSLRSILLEDIGAVIDLGPVEEVTDLALLGQTRSRAGRRRSFRGRRR
ncbi:MAG: hypothetical protein ACR2G7_10750 [Acidimicrobiales bacterium]